MRFIKYFTLALITFSLSHFFFGSFGDFYDVLIVSLLSAALFAIIFHFLIQSKIKALGKEKASGSYIRLSSNIFKSYLCIDDRTRFFIYKWKIFGASDILVKSHSKDDVVVTNYLLFKLIKTPNHTYLWI